MEARSVSEGIPARSVSEGIAGRSISEGEPPHLTLHLDRDLVDSLDCTCGNKRTVMQPQQLVGAGDAKCPACGQTAKPVLEHSVDAGTPLAKSKLSSLGIPPYDIVRVGDDRKEAVFLLAGDREAILGTP
jgi:hypothetical protein